MMSKIIISRHRWFKMKYNITEFLNEQIEMVEELCGELTAAEKEELKNDFFNRFGEIANELHVDVNLILNDFDIMVPIYESDYDINVAAAVIGGE